MEFCQFSVTNYKMESIFESILLEIEFLTSIFSPHFYY